MSLNQAFRETTHPAYTCISPESPRAPILIESPHHSTFFPPDFRIACDDIHVLRQADMHIDRIFEGAINLGLPYLGTRIARSYIDFNRATNSVHPDHIADRLHHIVPDADDFYAAAGLGLVRTKAYFGKDVLVTDAPPTEMEVLRRVAEYWEPYHAKLEQLIEGNVATFGQSLHLTCHSFPMAHMYEKDKMGGYTFFVGTRDSTTASDEVKNKVICILEGLGYEVADNLIFKGVELVKKHGRPQEDKHSLQIEIVREAYMDNDTCEPTDGFTEIQAAMTHLAAELSDYMNPNQKPVPMISEAVDPDLASEQIGPIAAQ